MPRPWSRVAGHQNSTPMFTSNRKPFGTTTRLSLLHRNEGSRATPAIRGILWHSCLTCKWIAGRDARTRSPDASAIASALEFWPVYLPRPEVDARRDMILRSFSRVCMCPSNSEAVAGLSRYGFWNSRGKVYDVTITAHRAQKLQWEPGRLTQRVRTLHSPRLHPAAAAVQIVRSLRSSRPNSELFHLVNRSGAATCGLRRPQPSFPANHYQLHDMFSVSSCRRRLRLSAALSFIADHPAGG
jgi:hypothetical protein